MYYLLPQLVILVSLFWNVQAWSATRSTVSVVVPSTTRILSSSSSSSSSRLSAQQLRRISFAKYEGLGNDFILIDDRDKTDPSLTPEQSAKLCNRNFSVGGDGVIFALQADLTTDEYDFKMRIYNSDGSEPEMCGNGIRCLAQFLADLGETSPVDGYKIDTLAGPIVPLMNEEEGTITVDMGPPELVGANVPCTLEANFEGESIVEQTLALDNGKEFKVSAVSMGNPHCIIFVDDLEKDIDFETEGPALECHPSFPAKTNVEFVQVMSPTHLKMKVWERGAGPTLACGTGTCALVVAAIRAGKIPRPTGDDPRVRVTLPGGDLFIEWRESNNKIYMTGPGTFSFSGSAELK